MGRLYGDAGRLYGDAALFGERHAVTWILASRSAGIGQQYGNRLAGGFWRTRFAAARRPFVVFCLAVAT